MQQIIVPVILGIVAVVVLFQLYNVLGRRTGYRVEDKPLIARPDDAEAAARLSGVPGEVARTPNIELLKTRDVNFNEINFLEKARETYQQVVLAFHKGELEAVRDKLSERVFGTFRSAVDERSSANPDTLSFVDPPKADIDVVDFNDDSAQVRVRFLSELAYESPPAVEEAVPVTDGPKPESVEIVGAQAKKDLGKPNRIYKRTAEFWTFQKGLRAQNSPWLLTRVEAAKA